MKQTFLEFIAPNWPGFIVAVIVGLVAFVVMALVIGMALNWVGVKRSF